jgi:hypothetical protein
MLETKCQSLLLEKTLSKVKKLPVTTQTSSAFPKVRLPGFSPSCMLEKWLCDDALRALEPNGKAASTGR